MHIDAELMVLRYSKKPKVETQQLVIGSYQHTINEMLLNFMESKICTIGEMWTLLMPYNNPKHDDGLTFYHPCLSLNPEYFTESTDHEGKPVMKTKVVREPALDIVFYWILCRMSEPVNHDAILNEKQEIIEPGRKYPATYASAIAQPIGLLLWFSSPEYITYWRKIYARELFTQSRYVELYRRYSWKPTVQTPTKFN